MKETGVWRWHHGVEAELSSTSAAARARKPRLRRVDGAINLPPVVSEMSLHFCKVVCTHESSFVKGIDEGRIAEFTAETIDPAMHGPEVRRNDVVLGSTAIQPRPLSGLVSHAGQIILECPSIGLESPPRSRYLELLCLFLSSRGVV